MEVNSADNPADRVFTRGEPKEIGHGGRSRSVAGCRQRAVPRSTALIAVIGLLAAAGAQAGTSGVRYTYDQAGRLVAAVYGVDALRIDYDFNACQN